MYTDMIVIIRQTQQSFTDDLIKITFSRLTRQILFNEIS